MAPSLTISETSYSHKPVSSKRNKEASELRKTLKPLMEKRRRARINESLNQLKTLILPLIGKDTSRYSKLEKADILEMTVRFLRDIPPVQTQNSADSYREGYRACIDRLSTILDKTKMMNGETCSRLLGHLQNSPDLCCQDCSRSPSPKLHSPRIVVHFNPRGSVGSASQNQQPNRPAPSLPSPSQVIWRPW
ncbi:transcription factor HES-2-like [Bombina bombina]|uniref:transcription factor HES-2-like n=1 Tax=Bombina bombina TaxID=8345 RepID=UPI00235AAD05|nr:transcription factor HES-2-like [Bombina bombina]